MPAIVEAAIEQASDILSVGDWDAAVKVLSPIASQLPELKVRTQAGDDPWNHLHLNGGGWELDAFRFESPLSEPADLFYAQAGLKSEWRLRTFIAAVDEPVEQIREAGPEPGLEVDGLDAPIKSYVSLSTLPGGRILPGKTYILGIFTKEQSAFDMHLALGLEPQAGQPEIIEARDIVNALGINLIETITRPESPGRKVELGEDVYELGFGLQGRLVVARTQSGTLSLVDTDSAERTGILAPDNDDYLIQSAVSPDGLHVAGISVGGSGSTVRIWNLTNQEQTNRFALDDLIARNVVFSPDSKSIAFSAVVRNNAVTPTGVVTVRAVATGEEVWRGELPDNDMHRLVFSPDGKQLVVSTTTRRDDPTPDFEKTRNRYVGVKAWDLPYNRIRAGHLVWWNLNQRSPLRTVDMGCPCRWLNFSPDGEKLASVNLNGVLQYWDSKTGQNMSLGVSGRKLAGEELFPGLGPFNPGLGTIEWSPDGKRLLACVSGEKPTLFNSESLKPMGSWTGHVKNITSYHQESMSMPTFAGWLTPDTRSAQEQNQPSLASATFSPDGRQIASSGSFDDTVRLWQTPDPITGVPAHAVVNSVGMHFVEIPAGQFLMGTEIPEGTPARYAKMIPREETPQHKVQISKPFRMSIHEVTVEQFSKFVDATDYISDAERSGGGYHIRIASVGFQKFRGLDWRNPGFKQEPNHPVVQVSYNDVEAFCKWLSDKESIVYRLPTEAEWEYACRAGTTGGYFDADGIWGNTGENSTAMNAADVSLLDHYKEYGGLVDWHEKYPFTAPVGSFTPNAFWLYDTHGNALEWCSDWYSTTYYSESRRVDPQGPATGTLRSQRGGTFFYRLSMCQSASRDKGKVNEAFSCTGFRVVQEIASDHKSE